MRGKPGELARGIESALGVDAYDVDARAACFVLAELVIVVRQAYTKGKAR